jgi:shikimate dehydrogenase
MRKFGLIGRSLEHSWSKDYFTQKFKLEALNNFEYHDYPLQNLAELDLLLKSDPQIEGLNVTLPFKIEITGHLSELENSARSIGAVNCIRIKRKYNKIHITGYNTDHKAFQETLAPEGLGKENSVLILGTGGAARAVAYALKELSIDHTMVSRKNSPGKLSYKNLNHQLINKFNIIINTTPLGMYPNTDEYPPLPYKYLSSDHFLYDLVYNPKLTQFLKKGYEKGCRIKNGLDMLHKQAELSWNIWNSEF